MKIELLNLENPTIEQMVEAGMDIIDYEAEFADEKHYVETTITNKDGEQLEVPPYWVLDNYAPDEERNKDNLHLLPVGVKNITVNLVQRTSNISC